MAIDSQLIAPAFDRAAASYDESAVLPREIESRLLEKLDGLSITPSAIIDVGSGTGSAAANLARRFPDAQIQLVDLSPAMLQLAQQRLAGYGERCQFIQADAVQLPMADRSVDFVFSNLMLPWSEDVPAVLNEFRRVLMPGGLLLFSTFGPDTLYELRASWGQVDRGIHVSTFADMHVVGDELLRTGFADPVMDVERLTVTYPGVHQLMRELKAIGAKNIDKARRRTLTGKQRLARMVEIYESNFKENERIWSSYEVVYGHAVGPVDGQPRRTDDGMVAEISVDQLRGSRREK